MNDSEAVLRSQVGYYSARAREYDEWFLRQGRYDHGEELNGAWFREADLVAAALDEAAPAGAILELACGTGIWTERLARYSTDLTALDAVEAVVELNRERLPAAGIEYVLADVFQWEPARRYDFIFFSFWLSHVPPDRFDEFWQRLAAWLAPGGRVFLIDSLAEATGSAVGQTRPDEAHVQVRRLNDGSEYQIYKVYYEPEELTERLKALGWQASLHASGAYFLYGSCASVTNP